MPGAAKPTGQNACPSRILREFSRMGQVGTSSRKDFPLRVFPQGGVDETRRAAVHRTGLPMDGAPAAFQRA